MDLDEQEMSTQQGAVPGVMQPPQRAASSPGGSGSLPRTGFPLIPMPGLTHSVSSAASSESASEIAHGSEDKWAGCSQANKCTIQSEVMRVEGVENLAAEVKFPLVIKDEQFVACITEMLQWRRDGLQYPGTNPMSYREWINGLSDHRIENDDHYNLGMWRRALYGHWASHLNACDRGGVEAEIRRGVDDMVEIAFELRLRSTHKFRAERNLFLPAKPRTATADMVTFMPLPADWRKFLATLNNAHVFAADTDFATPTLVTFCVEAKVSDSTAARRQLTLDLCSAQNQRRALGFDDGYVFGATLVGKEFQLFVSEWLEDTVLVQLMGIKFSFESFQHFLECYIFLCKLSDYIARDVNEMFGKWRNPATKEEIKNKNRDFIRGPPWRLRAKPKTDSGKSSGSNKRARTDGGGSQRDGDFDFDSDFDNEDENNHMVMEADYESERIPPGGLPLVEANLRTLDKTVHDMDIPDHPPAKDIRGWARQSASSVIA